jgi:hypothetical protein
LLPKNLKIKIQVVLYGCGTWSLTFRKERWLRVFEKRLLRKKFGPKRDEVTGEWGKLHNQELSDLYFSPSVVRVITSRRAGQVALMGEGHVACRGRTEVFTGFWWGNLKERDHLEDPGIGRILLMWIFRKWDMRAWTGSIWLRIGTGGGHL